MATISKRSELFLSRSTFSKLQSLLLLLQRGKHTSSGENVSSSLAKVEPKDRGTFDPSIWKTYDSRAVRIKNSAISKPAWTALSVLRGKDMLLNRVPKDFDIITTASLRQVKRLFNRCFIVGRRFPLGHVHLLGTIIEVSSFKKEGEEKSKGKNDIPHKALEACDEIDILRWENSIQRDFTINGLFLEPSKHKVYDYVNGMKDLRCSEVRTVIPAQLSFKEDCARILRCLRIAARLDFDLCDETAKAIHELSSLVRDLETTRLNMELNFMLSYGAAGPSIELLHEYRLLEIFLPFHAAYLDDQTKLGVDGTDTILMYLFSNMDKLLAPDRPCDCTLWLGLLGFHTALTTRLQKIKVLPLFSALLYHGSWPKAVDSIKQMGLGKSSANEPVSEEMLKKEIMEFGLLAKESMNVFTSLDCINGHLERCHNAPKFCGKIVISEKKRKNAQQLFDGLDHEIESYDKTRKIYEINYELLRSGQQDETRFVLGKIIMDTINSLEIDKDQGIIYDSMNPEYLTWKESMDKEKMDEIQEILDEIKSEKGIKHNLTAKEVLDRRNDMEEAIIDMIYSDSDEERVNYMDDTILPPIEELIMDMIEESADAAACRERKAKHHKVYKDTSKKTKKERESHSLNTKDGFKKRDNKTKKNYQSLPKKAVIKVVKSVANENGSEMNNESTKKGSNMNNAKTGNLSALFK